MNRIFSLAAFCLAAIFLMILFTPKSYAEDWLYTVRKGDTIWGLSHKYLKDPMLFQEIQRYNGVEYDRQIPPGVTLKFPMEYLKFAPAEVQVKTVNGQAHYICRGVKQSLTLKVKLVLDDVLLTNPGSSVALLFADGSEMLVGEKSELIFDVQTKWGETGMVDSRMRLMKGSAEGRVKTLTGPGAHFEVQTPSAVATVRGTEFRVRLDESDSNIVFNEVDEGKVGVQLHEQRKLVNQGFGVKTSKGAPIAEPKPLLPAPKFVNAKDTYPGLPVTLTWQPIDDATSYQIELFKDAAMTELLSKSTVKRHQYTLDSVALDEYSIRVRAIDVDGLQGLNNSTRFVVAPVPKSPVPLTAAEEKLAGEAVRMKWQESEAAEGYHWRLMQSDTKKVVKEANTNNPSVELLQGLPEGDYYWQVAGANRNGLGRYSEPVAVSSRLPSPPVLEPVVETIEYGEALQVSWTSVPMASEYRWQVSTSAEFEQIVEQGETKSLQIILKDLPQRELYIRVAAKGPFNQNRFSESKKFEVVEPDNGKTAFGIGSVLLFILLL